MPPPGRVLQVTVTKTIECDSEYRLPVYESVSVLPSRIEGKGRFYPPELTEEEQHTLEHRMKQDLDI